MMVWYDGMMTLENGDAIYNKNYWRVPATKKGSGWLSFEFYLFIVGWFEGFLVF